VEDWIEARLKPNRKTDVTTSQRKRFLRGMVAKHRTAQLLPRLHSNLTSPQHNIGNVGRSLIGSPNQNSTFFPGVRVLWKMTIFVEERLTQKKRVEEEEEKKKPWPTFRVGCQNNLGESLAKIYAMWGNDRH